MSDLQDANSHPTYWMMTLLGEQPDGGWDEELAQINAIASQGRGLIDQKYRDWIWNNRAELAEQIKDRARWESVIARLWDRRIAQAGISAQRPSSIKVDFHKVRFPRPVFLPNGAEGISLTSCVCEQEVRTNHGDFRSLEKTTFNRPVRIKTLARRSKLSWATFNDGFEVKVQVEENVSFADSTFWPCRSCPQNEAENNLIEWKDGAAFSGVRFQGGVDFSRATFHGAVTFQDCEFEGIAKFKSARFAAITIFSHADFHKFSDFFQAEFGTQSDEKHHITFANATFHAPVSFQQAVFPVRLPVLSGTTLHATTTVTTGDAHWPKRGPGYLRRLDEWIGLRKTRDWQPLEEVKASAAALRHAMSRQNLPEEEHFFFRREMYAGTRTGPLPTGVLTRLFFEWPSEYGHSVMRPAALLFVVWLVGVWFFRSQPQFAALDPWFYSFANMFKFFGLQRTYFDLDVIQAWPSTLQHWSAGQTVLSFVLLFYLGLGLRTRFGLR